MLYPTELRARAVIIATCSAGGNLGGGDCARDCARKPARHVLKVGGASDVVAVEHAARAVACDLHGDALRDARVNHVADGGATEIVSEHPGSTRLRAGRRPYLPVVSSSLSDSPTTQTWEQKRDHSFNLALERLHAVDLAHDASLEVGRHVDEAPVIVLCRAGV